MLSEEIESKTHIDARVITSDVMLKNGYEVDDDGYYLDVKFKLGRQPARIVDANNVGEYYHEVDLWCRKKHDTGLVEEIFIEFDGDDTRHEYTDEDGSTRPPLNSSKYMHKKQKGNDEDFESWLRKVRPDAILIRINKEEIIKRKDSRIAVYQYIRSMVKKSIVDFIS